LTDLIEVGVNIFSDRATFDSILNKEDWQYKWMEPITVPTYKRATTLTAAIIEGYHWV
jgi:hypothetical protein